MKQRNIRYRAFTKLSAVGRQVMRLSPIIKAIIAVALAFSLFGLFFQFVFSYLNQRVNGPTLTTVNFAAPFVMSIASVLFFIQRMFSSRGLSIFDGTPKTLKILSCILFVLLLLWQLRYILRYVDIKQTQDTFAFITEVLPMTAAFVMTFLLLLGVAKRNTSATIGSQQKGR